MGTDMVLTSYGVSLAPFTSFKYPGRVLMAEDYDWPEVVRNLRRARQKWEQMTRVLSREGEDSQTLGQIYLEVVQSIMIYESESLVLTLCMKRVWGGCHHRVARRLTGRQPRRGRDGGWFYLLLENVMGEVGLREVRTYASRRQNTVPYYIATRPIMDLCLA